MSIKKKKKILYTICGIFLILSFISIGSYAYLRFTTYGSDNLIKAGCLKITTLSETAGINIPDGIPTTDGDGILTTPYTITIKNTCNVDANYTTTLNAINNSDLTNKSKIKLAVNGSVTKGPKLLSDTKEYPVVTLAEKPEIVKESYLLDSGILKINEEKTYEIRLWIDINATEFIGSFESKVIIEATNANETSSVTNLANNWKSYLDGKINISEVETIYTENKIDNSTSRPVTVNGFETTASLIETIDVSEQQNGEVLLKVYRYTEQSGTSYKDKYILVIQQDGEVIAPVNSSGLFEGFNSCTNIDLTNLNTSNVTNMENMFKGCTNLENLDLTTFDTSKVTNAEGMFSSGESTGNISATIKVDNDKWTLTSDDYKGNVNITDDTGDTAVANLSKDWKSLIGSRTLRSGIYTENTIDATESRTINNMAVTLKETIDVSEQKNNKVLLRIYEYKQSQFITRYLGVIQQEGGVIAPTDSSSLFEGIATTYIDLEHLNTSNVTNMSRMFANSTELDTLNITTLDTSKVTNATSMFEGCDNLVEINVGCSWTLTSSDYGTLTGTINTVC